jgi:signal transduction histidine kinase
MSNHHPSLDPIVVAMQVGMQVVFAGLLCFVVAMAVLDPARGTPAIVTFACLLGAAYVLVLLGHAVGDARSRRRLELWGLAAVVATSLALMWLTPNAAYLLFPLAFLYLERLTPRVGTAVVLATTATAVALLGLHGGWTVGVVLGPLVTAGVAILIGLSSLALRRQNAEQEALYRDLLAVQDQLVVSERNAGRLAERARLAREIHDTVAQSLSSITLLLHAVERADPSAPTVAQVRLARETATASLAETRRFIRELSPPLLDEQSLGGALRRLAAGTWATPELQIDVRVADSLELPMPLQTALLRVAQGAMANVMAHSHASHATIEIVTADDAVRMTVRDNGVGMGRVAESDRRPSGDSFGLRATDERVTQLGGGMTLTSAPAEGTTVAVWLPVGRR